jgi:hypothetical protein
MRRSNVCSSYQPHFPILSNNLLLQALLFSPFNAQTLLRTLCAIAMKLELLVLKKYVRRGSGFVEEPVFVLVDLNKADSYPLNYVCLLPKNLETTNRESNKFYEIYGKESNQIATLLTKALRSETDSDVRDDIRKRLKALQPKPTKSDKFVVSGGYFYGPIKFGRSMQKKDK